MEISSEVVPAGSSAIWTLALASQAWGEFPELKMRERNDFVSAVHDSIRPVDRLELKAYDQRGFVVAGLVCALELADPHVGECLSALFHYVLPEYRNRGLAGTFLRGMVREAQRMGLTCISYTHRSGPWAYNIKYRKVQNGKDR